MMDKKVRFEFLIEPDLAARVNALAKEPGATKTDIIVKAIKVFLERGIESEFAAQTAMRFDRLSRELESVNRQLAVFQQGYEVAQSDRKRILRGGQLTYEILRRFVRLSLELSAHIPMPEGDAKAVFQERWGKLADQVNSQFTSDEPASTPTEERGKA
jgi:hypothetical protein